MAETVPELRQEIARLEAQVDALSAELRETNQGVLALYAELDDNAHRLRDASDLKSRFLSYMSHEFRTPLSSILSIARILQDRLDGPLTDEQQKQVQFIQTSARELTEMVSDLLDLAKVEAGRVTISPEWFDMVDLFSALRGMFKPILQSHSVSLIFEEPQNIPRIFTDDNKLSQILRNFISNALKFTPEGEVRVSATLIDGDRVTFRVADTGIGIGSEHVKSLFQDFVQVDAPIQKRLRGTGLGLSLSRKLALLLGGDVAVESTLGQGSSFSVTIPVTLSMADGGAATTGVPGGERMTAMATRAPASILVVDDNAPTRYSTARVLRSEGFTVLEAGTGQDALRLAAEPLDLVVLDVNLPDIDGFEVCRRLRAAPVTARTPVIHLSATFVNDVDKVQGLDAGADGYITHPVEPPVLIATVNAFLRARRAEDALRESEAKFKAVFEQALNGIALLSHDMIFLEVNPAMCATFGRDRANVIGKHISAFNAGGSEHRVDEITTALAAAGAWRGTLPVLHADGRHVELDWSVSIHSGPGIRLAITTDVTERREIEAERERLLASETAARAEAERANQVKDDFLAALSHELRTPLNAIVGWSQLLKQRVEGGDSDVVSGINAIDRNARVQAQLIADLLDVSRVASGKLQLERQWFDPVEEVAAAIENVQPAARARDIAVDVTLEGHREPLLWDPARFQQVVWNLLDNAVKFSPEGGRVLVRLLQTEADLELTVADQGPGISQDFLPHVFEPFRQEHVGTKRGHGGLGLGLAIVRHLVEAHDGRIVATSPGDQRGSTFTVRLPRQGLPLGPVPPVPVPAAPLPSLDGVRVLVVEDDFDARVLIRRMLEDAGAQVTDTSNVDAAIECIDGARPAIVVSDIALPHQDGYDLIRRIRERYRADVLPAIALTAFARDEDRTRALGAGYQAHLSKPVDPRQLLTLTAGLVQGAARLTGRA